MSLTTNIPSASQDRWIYASLRVRDGTRHLKPREVCSDFVYFAEPPGLTCSEIEIILTNGDAEQRQMARVLPHDPGATRIPIELIRAG